MHQFTVTNTLEDQLLERVLVEMEPEEAAAWEQVTLIPAKSVPYGSPQVTYSCWRRVPDAGLGGDAFACMLKFRVKDVDPRTGEADEGEVRACAARVTAACAAQPPPPPLRAQGYDEDYALEVVPVTSADFTIRSSNADLRETWDVLGEEAEVSEDFQLQTKTIKEAVDGLVDCLNMEVLACQPMRVRRT